MQIPLFPPESKWAPPAMVDLPSWHDAKRVAVDVETCDPKLKDLGPGVRRGGFLVGVSFAIEDGPSYYLPIRHLGGDNLPEEAVLSYLRGAAADFSGVLVGAHLPYDLDYLEEERIGFRPRFFQDVQIADPLINELHTSYSLQNISQRYGLPGKDERLLEEAAKAHGVDPKSGLWKLPARYVGPYAEQDVRLPLQIMRKQERLLEDLDLWKIFRLECEVLPLLVKLRRRGVRIDLERLEQVELWSLAQEAQAYEAIWLETGVRVGYRDIWTAQALVPVLTKIGIALPLTSTGKPSITKDILAGAGHPVAEAILRARKMNKLRTTFAASIREHLVNGRIHCSFNQIAVETEEGGMKGVRFGRMSCTNPNLQQQPSRDDFAKLWRSIYIPEEGALWACNDYSQQEPRWTTHFANTLGLPGAAKAAERYRTDPKMDNHTLMAELVGWSGKEGRTRAKTIFLGLCYGEGGAKLCRQLGLPTRWACSTGKERTIRYFATQAQALEAAAGHSQKFVWEAAGEEGQAILDEFDARAPYIRMLAQRASQRAKEVGAIRTAGGRVLHFPQNMDGSYEWTHKALNRLIQGSSADQTKLAMVRLDQEVPEFFMQLQVHDEIDASVASEEIARKAARVMVECMPTTVPFRVDVEVGPNWGELRLCEQ